VVAQPRLLVVVLLAEAQHLRLLLPQLLRRGPQYLELLALDISPGF
jgi:hypothetical protein